VGWGLCESVSHETGRLSKNELKPWLNQFRVIPPEANAEFVPDEDVLDVYTCAYDPHHGRLFR